MEADAPQPQLPISGNGDGDPHPIPVRITKVSPIAGAVTGGITVTLTGRGFQQGAEVYFGDSPSPEVIVLSSFIAQAKLPAATQTGSVNVSLFNPDGSEATKPGGFTYVVTGTGAAAEVLGVSPLCVIEDTESEVSLRGRNLIEAYTNGMLALRGPTRAQVTVLNSTSSRDEATGIEELTFDVRVTAMPPLEPLERMAIQVLASRRPGAATDGVFESSRQMFTVLPRARPVPLAYSANLEPGKPNLVVVAGRNLEGCTLDMGAGATVHLQRSEDRILSGIVTVMDGTAATASPQLSVRNASGDEVAQYAMWIAPDASFAGAAAPMGEAAASVTAESTTGDISLTLTPVPGQQMTAPTEHDSAVFNLNGASSSSLFFDWTNFEITILDLTFLLPIVHEVHLIPFFDGISADGLSDLPVLAQVGRLFRLRGVGLLVALHVDIIIHISVVLIIGFIFDIWDFGLFNEFPEYGWVIGSVVIGIRIEIDIFIILSFLLAAVLPEGRLHKLFALNLVAELDFKISDDGHHLVFGADYHVNYTRIGPALTNLLPCGGRFQLASENGQTVFPDAFGGHQSFYFARAEGECCVPWDFDLRLVRFVEGQSEETVQESFRADFCLNAAPNPNPMDVLIVSNRTPNGFPPPLEMDIEESDFLRALARPVDEAGRPIPGPRRDLRTLGFSVQFYLISASDVVLDPAPLLNGAADAILPGQNIIRVAASSVGPVIDEETGEELPFGFWPDAVMGFDIVNFLGRGLLPAVRAGNLPVIINLPLVKVTVEPVLAYRVDPTNKTTLTESRIISHVSNAQQQNLPVWEVERSEPFMNQRSYVLAVKLTPEAGRSLPSRMTLSFTVKTVQMELLPIGTTTPQPGPPLADIPQLQQAGDKFTQERRSSSDVKQFFTGKLVEQSRQFTLTLDPVPPAGQLIEIGNSIVGSTDGLLIIPNNKEATGQPVRLVPPGQKVADRYVLLTVELKVESGDAQLSTPQSVLGAAVTNEETFEEYLRVFKEPQGLLAASTKLSGFADGFYRKLLSSGPTNDVLNEQGTTLWDNACAEVQTSLLDDRPLYWARLHAIAALRAYCKSKSVTLTDAMIHQFEWPSRGLDAAGVIRFGADASRSRRAIVTGFDPFFLPGQPDISNPSGLVALSLNKKILNPNRAVFIKTDAVTQGTWRGRYGNDGYNVINDTASYPSYASVTPAGQSSFTWAASTAEARALQKATGTDRFAACWFGSQFTVEVNITDGRMHQVALYVLDWDGNNGRSETIDVLDASTPTNDVLDSHSVSAFSGGQYLIWEVSGRVKFRVTNTGGAASNAVVSGIFFDTPAGTSDVFIRTAVFPVRYKDFNERIVENAVKDDLSSVVMVMTCSRGVDNYDVDRFPARNRGPNLIDNNRGLTPTTVTEPPSLTVLQKVKPAQLQYLETTLPYSLVIKKAEETRKLPAPQSGPPPFTGPERWFILNQSFWVLNVTPPTLPQRRIPGKYEPYPDAGGVDDLQTYDPASVAKPGANEISFRGSGGNYLSNEIFYRVALLRESERPALKAGERSPLATGHFHLPWPGPSGNDPQNTGPGLLYSVRTAAERFLKSLFRMRVSEDIPLPQITFPRTNVNTTSAAQTIAPFNITQETINVFTVDVSPPFAVQWPGPRPIPLSRGTSLPLSFIFKPTTLGVHTQTAKLHDSNGELLLMITLTGEGVPTYSITGQVKADNLPLQGVQVTLSGSRTASVTTGTDGRYSFTGLDAGDNYTITPSRANYTFTPSSQSFSGLAADQSADFTATLNRHRIRGRVRLASGLAVPNATVTLSGTVSGTAMTDASGEYLFADLSEGGSYTVSVSRANYSFALVSQDFNNLLADVDFDFAGTLVSYNIMGRVTSGSAGLDGVNVTLSGSQPASKTTDAFGNYSFTVMAEGNYTVTPSKLHYAFAPQVADFSNLSANQAANFTAMLNRHRISGRVTTAAGAGIPGVTLTLSGLQTPTTTTTDAVGNYSFVDLPAGGNYSVTLSRANYTFTPGSRSFSDLGADQTADFTGALVSYTIGGRITSGSTGLGGVTVNLSGSQNAVVTTDASGNYSFTVTAEGSYTVTPSKPHYTFAPQSLGFNNLSANQSAAFSATLNQHTISGRITSTGGAALANVTLSLSGSQSGTATSDASGNYSFAGLLAGGNYTITPSRASYTFTPGSRSFSDLGADQAADFIDALVSYTISGRVTSGVVGLVGVTVNLSGSKTAATTTDASGNYSFVVLAEGNYTVTPSASHYTFTPLNANFNNLGANQAANFSATLNRHTLSGRVTTPNGVALAGVAVNLSGSRTATATTDTSGSYSFGDLPAGGSYTLTVSRTNYAFAIPSRSFSDLGANQTADFTGSLVNYTISGRVTSGGSGLGGVTVTLSGSQSSSATTDTSGNYSFTVPAEGNYSVTSSKLHYTLAPQPAAFSNLGANQSADFNAILNRHTISGRVTTAGGIALPNVTLRLSGSQSGTVTSDASGNYSFSLMAGGSYTVTAVRANYAFTPGSRSFTDLGADQAADFAGALVNYAIGGRITRGDVGFGGVTVELSGSQSSTATTDASGNYSFTVKAEGNYTVTPSKQYYTFAPQSAVFSSLGTNQTANFNGTLNQHTISGNVITAGGVALSNVTARLSGSQTATATTDASGNYSFANLLAGGSYTVTPSRVNYAFNPASQSFGSLDANQTASFVTALVHYNLSGRVTSNGQGLAGVTVTLGGAETGTVITDASGNYTFTVTAEGNYTVTPSKYHYTFAPQSPSFSNLGGNQTADFSATLDHHTISGRVTTAAGAALPGVTVRLSGSQAATVTTDAAGSYSFTALPAGGEYTVTLSRANYTLTPDSQSFSDLGANQAADFTGALVNYTISGRVTSGGTGLGGVTVNLGGSQTATATTNDDGSYSFSILAEGDYTVALSERHYTFTPPGTSFNNLTANQTADFDATLNHHTLSGHVTAADGNGIPGVTVALSGSQSVATTTDASGNYSFADLPAVGGYTVTAARANYAFTPDSRSFDDLVASQTVDFTGALVNYTISGRVTSGSTGLGGVTVKLSGSETVTTVTDGAGNYSFVVTAEGDYTVSPSEHYAFTPLNATFNDIAADQSTDFAAAANRHRISGRVTNPVGVAFPNVTLALSGSETVTAKTDAAGNYSFASLPEGGNYTVTPKLFGYTFTPLSHTLNGLSTDQSGDCAAGPVGGVRINLALPSGGAVFSVSTMYKLSGGIRAVINGDIRSVRWREAPPDDSVGRLDVTFAGEKVISEVHVFSTQDNLAAYAELFEALPFTQHGLQDFDVEYWTGAGWRPVPEGAVTNNNRVWVKIAFPPLRTTRIRVVVRRVLGG
jgi:hypothetical protein